MKKKKTKFALLLVMMFVPATLEGCILGGLIGGAGRLVGGAVVGAGRLLGAGVRGVGNLLFGVQVGPGELTRPIAGGLPGAPR